MPRNPSRYDVGDSLTGFGGSFRSFRWRYDGNIEKNIDRKTASKPPAIFSLLEHISFFVQRRPFPNLMLSNSSRRIDKMDAVGKNS